MNDLLKLLLVLIVFFLFIGLAWRVAWKLGLLMPASKKGAVATERKTPSASYRIREGVLTPGERAFLPALRDAVALAWATGRTPSAPPPTVFASVRLAEILEADARKSDDWSARQSAFNKIGSKQADFVVCDAATTRPLLVVELDDPSHDRRDRAERDGFVDGACGSAGLPILHVRAAAKYSTQELAKAIAGRVGFGGR